MKRKWPGAAITLVAARTMYPVPLRELNPFIDEVIVHEKSSLWAQYAFYRSLRGHGFDLAVVPSTVRVSRSSHLAAYLSGAPVRAGIASLDGERNPSARLLTHVCHVRWSADCVHQIDRNLEIAGLLGCDIRDGSIFAPPIRTTPASEREALAILAALEGDADHRPIGMHAGAGKVANVWPTDRFAELAARIFTRHGVPVLLTSGAIDREVVDRLVRMLDRDRIPHRVVENGSMPVLASLFGRLSCYVTNDTGTMHIAAAAGAAVVSVFGPTHAWEWAPRSASSIALQSPTGSIGDISTDEVEAAVERVLLRDADPGVVPGGIDIVN